MIRLGAARQLVRGSSSMNLPALGHGDARERITRDEPGISATIADEATDVQGRTGRIGATDFAAMISVKPSMDMLSFGGGRR